jgi:flagellar hook-associated protein 1
MALSTALNSALSGLQVTSRGTQIVADNIANAGTDGYGVRSLTQAARSIGGNGTGVIATGVDRRMDAALVGAVRLASAEQDAAALKQSFWSQLENTLGVSGGTNGLLTQISELDSALSTAIAAPDSRAALAQVAQAASDLTQVFHNAQNTLLDARDTADGMIARDIDALNTLLSDAVRLNQEIQQQSVSGRSPAALMDQRQLVVNQIAGLMPVTEIPRDFGRIMLIAADGTILVDQHAAQFAFQRSPNPQPGDTVANGGLAEITLGTRSFGSEHTILGNGRLGAAMAIRDVHVPAMQAGLDWVAADLISRFADPAVDPTLPTGAFGLFQDPVNAPPLVPLGISGRIALSPSVAPDDPSAFWRLRDGLGAISIGPVGANGLLNGLRDALRLSSPAGVLGQPARDVHGHATELLSAVTINRLRADSQEAQAATRAAVLDQQLRSQGVDTDAQMQKLLVLEQNYAANAKVIVTLDQMIQTLLEI